MMSQHYSKERVRRGITNFLIGKGVSSVAGFGAMVLVVRLLPVNMFAVYSVLVALIEVITALSGLGLGHVLLRYVPELYANHYLSALRQLIFKSLQLRTTILLTLAFICYSASEKIAPLLGLEDWTTAFEVFLLVVIFRSTGHFLSQILESTLHQGAAQLGFSLAALARLVGMTFLLKKENAELVDVIRVEAFSDMLAMLVMLVRVTRVAVNREGEVDAPSGNQKRLRDYLCQIRNFALTGYIQHVVVLPFGSNMNRMLGGRMLSTMAMANFGFALSLYEYVKRYLPAQLLVGLIRPVVVARFTEKKDFCAAAKLCEQVLHVNILLVGFGITYLCVGGSETLAIISGGKYGNEANGILICLLIVLLLETHRLQLEVLVQTVERYAIMIPSNLLLSASVIAAVIIIPTIGPIAFPLANGCGLLVANTWVQHRLKANGYVYRFNWSNLAGNMLVILLSVSSGHIVKTAGLPWYLSIITALTTFVIAGWKVNGHSLLSLKHDFWSKTPDVMPDKKKIILSTK